MAVSNRVKSALTTTVLATAATGSWPAAASTTTRTSRSPTAPTRTARSSTTTTATTATAGGGLFFLYVGGFGRGLPVGTVLPSGGTRIDPRDTTARRNAGLAATGAVAAGTRVSGGIGSGTGGRVGAGG